MERSSHLGAGEILTRRRDPALLFILETFRPGETIVQNHPLRAVVQTLQGDGHVLLLPLERLPTPAITTYLSGRFP